MRASDPRPHRLTVTGMKGLSESTPGRRHGLLVAAIVASGALSLLSAACGGSARRSGSPTTGTSTVPASAVAYSACIRSHGVPNYPDPTSSGQLPKGDAHQFGVSFSEYQAAQQACKHLLPTGGSLHKQEYQCIQSADCPQALVQQMLTADRKLAACMRSHGVPNFPDPTTDSNGPIFNITKAGISDAASHSRQFESELDACARLVGPNVTESFE